MAYLVEVDGVTVETIRPPKPVSMRLEPMGNSLIFLSPQPANYEELRDPMVAPPKVPPVVFSRQGKIVAHSWQELLSQPAGAYLGVQGATGVVAHIEDV